MGGSPGLFSGSGSPGVCVHVHLCVSRRGRGRAEDVACVPTCLCSLVYTCAGGARVRGGAQNAQTDWLARAEQGLLWRPLPDCTPVLHAAPLGRPRPLGLQLYTPQPPLNCMHATHRALPRLLELLLGHLWIARQGLGQKHLVHLLKLGENVWPPARLGSVPLLQKGSSGEPELCHAGSSGGGHKVELCYPPAAHLGESAAPPRLAVRHGPPRSGRACCSWVLVMAGSVRPCVLCVGTQLGPVYAAGSPASL